MINTIPTKGSMRCPNLRIIIDCTVMKIPRPRNPVAKQLTFSNYKNSNTARALAGNSPTGVESFVAEFFSGNVSYK